MTQATPLDLPGITLSGTTASCDAARRIYDPWAPLVYGAKTSGILPYGFAELPEATIEDILVSLQAPWSIPAGFYGRVTFIVDPGGEYVRRTGFVDGVEDGWPFMLKPLATVQLWPGLIHPFIEVRKCLVGPVAIKKGDLILVAPETNEVDISVYGGLQVFAAPIWKTPDGRFPLATGVVHAMPLNSEAPSGAQPSYRGIVPVKTGGTSVTLRFTAPPGSSMSIDHASIGIRTGGQADMAATPVQLTFGGFAGVTVPAGQSVECDAAFLTVPNDSDLVIDVNMPNNTAWAFKGAAGPLSGVKTYWSATAAYNTAAQSSPTLQAGRLHCVDYVKVV